MFTTENALDLTARKTHWATSVFKLLALSAWNSDLLLNWFGHLQFQMCYWDAVSQHIIHFWYGSLNGMLDHVQFSQPNLSICQALVAFATNHSRASQVRLLGGSKRTWFDHFLPKFGRLLISESTASNFWMSFLQFLTWICLNMGHPRIQWFYRWSSVFFIVPQTKKNNTWGVLHVLHIPYVCTRGHHIFSNHLKSSSSGSLHSWTKSWYCSSVAVFFSLGSTFTCGTPHGSPGHISARPVQHTGAWRERRGRWVRDDLLDVLAQDAHVSAPRQGGMPCLADVHWSNI